MGLSTNLVAYYGFNASSSHDDTGDGNNGTDTSMTYSGAAAKLGADGASFNGSSSKISVPSNVYSLFNGTYSWTWNAWLNIPSRSSQYTPVNNYNGSPGGQNDSFRIYFDTGAFKWHAGRGDGSSSDDVTLGTVISASTWYMVTIVYNGSTIQAYTNGAADGSGSSTRSGVTSSLGYLGTEQGNNFYNGYMDEVGYWSRALSSTEVSQLYNGGAGLGYPFSSGLSLVESESTAISDSASLVVYNPLPSINVTDSTAIGELVILKTAYPTVNTELPCSISVSNYKYLTPTLLAAQEANAKQSSFRVQIIDDTVQPNQTVSTNLPPFQNGSTCIAPDGNVLGVGLDASNNVVFYKGINLHSGTWDFSLILITPSSGINYLNSYNRYCISCTDWENGTYAVVITLFYSFDNNSTPLAIGTYISKNAGLTFSQNAAEDNAAMLSSLYSSGATNLGLAPFKPIYSQGNISYGYFFIVPNSKTFLSIYKGYDIWYSQVTITSSTITYNQQKWNPRYINSGDWTIQNLDSFYLNGKNHVVFSGFRNVLDIANTANRIPTPNYGIWVSSLLQYAGASDLVSPNVVPADVWDTPRQIISSFGSSASNQNSFTNPSAVVINGIVNVIFSATTVDSINSETIGDVTTHENAMISQSADGQNFSYPSILVDGGGNELVFSAVNQLVSYVPQGTYLYLFNNGQVWEFVQNNIVADVTNYVTSYSIQDTAGQPSSLTLTIANQNNIWVGSAPTAPGAAAISGNKKIVIEQGYFNANNVPELVPRNIYYIDDIQIGTSSSANTLTILGRDLHKKLMTTITRYPYSWTGPFLYIDNFDGSTLGNWNQQSGTWVEQNNEMVINDASIGDVAIITLSNIQFISQSYILQVACGTTGGGGGQVCVYAIFVDSTTWLRFRIDDSGGSKVYVEQSIEGTVTVLSVEGQSSFLGLTNVFIRQYDYFKFAFFYSVPSGGNLHPGNSLGWPDSNYAAMYNSVLGGFEFDVTAAFEPILSQPFSVGMGMNDYIGAFSSLQFAQFNNSNSIKSVLPSLVAKASVFSPDIENQITDNLFVPSNFYPDATSITANRVMNIGNSSSAVNEWYLPVEINDGEVTFNAQMVSSSNPLKFYFYFRSDSSSNSFGNAYRWYFVQGTNGLFMQFQRYYLGTWFNFGYLTYLNNTSASLNFDIRQPHIYRIVFALAWSYVFIDGIMVAAMNDNNKAPGIGGASIAPLTNGFIGWGTEAGMNLYVSDIEIPDFWKENANFSLNPGDDIENASLSLVQSIQGWLYSNLIGIMKAILLNHYDASTYTYQDLIATQTVDNSDKEYVSQVSVYGTGVSATARNTNLMTGAQTREEVIVDYTIMTQDDAQTRANLALTNANQYQNQYSPAQAMNVGSELFDAVTVVDTGNNTSGVNSITRVYGQTFTTGSSNNAGGYSIQIETGDI